MKTIIRILPAFFLFLALSFTVRQDDEAALLRRAEKLHDRIISIDTHTDTALDLIKPDADLSKVQASFPRLREGRVDCCFYPVFVDQGPLDEETEARVYDETLTKMKAIRAYIEARPKEAAIALTAKDIARNKKRHRLSLVMGLENAYPIGRDLSRLQAFYDLGTRIITLSHNYDNDVCDASRYPQNTWGGLSPFGKDLVREMNRLGVIVDCSHASTATLYDCLALSTAPVICSHSCVYAIKDHPRNLTDDEIRAIAAKGGVIQVTTGRWALSWLPHAEVNVGTFCDHVEYIRNLVGVEYVGIGTDFDGGGGMNGLEDASKMKDKERKKPSSSRPMRFVTDGGYEVLVGRNNMQNDRLTMKEAERFDWFFHVKNAPGSHVIMISRGDEPPAEDFTQAARLAAYYSSKRDGENVEVDYTQVRNIKKPANSAPGFVIYSQNYSAVVTPDADEAARLRTDKDRK